MITPCYHLISVKTPEQECQIVKIGPWEIGLILLIVLLIFGSGKIAGLGKTIGKAVHGFKEEVNAGAEKGKNKIDTEPTKPLVETSAVQHPLRTPEVPTASKTHV
jgi:sec-independent protein translocase protein TatA